MRIKVELSKTAIIDLESIIEYYFALNRAAASRYYREIIGRIKKLAAFPHIGRIVPEFEEEFYDKYRELIYENFRIIYRVEGKRIFILRIIDARRLLSFDFITDVV
jgi:plasmid stabilization system protein ParE